LLDTRVRRRGAGEEADDRGGAELAFEQAGERRLRQLPAKAESADDVDVLGFQRFERHRIDQGTQPDAGPTTPGQRPAILPLSAAGSVGDGVFISIEIGLDRIFLSRRWTRHCRRSTATSIRSYPDRAPFHAFEKQLLHGEIVFGVEDDDLGFRLIGFQ